MIIWQRHRKTVLTDKTDSAYQAGYSKQSLHTEIKILKTKFNVLLNYTSGKHVRAIYTPLNPTFI